MPRADRSEVPGSITFIVDLTCDEGSWTFALAPDVSRAIVVGSRADADVRIERPLVAPVHFHLEREGDAVLLVPGYGRGVQVNAQPVRGPVALEDATIEFSGLSMRAKIRRAAASGRSHARFAPVAEDAPTASISLDSAPTGACGLLGESSTEAPTTAFDRTYLGARQGGLAESLDDAKTEVMEVMGFDTEPERAIPAAVSAPDQPVPSEAEKGPAVVGGLATAANAMDATEAITMAVPPAPPSWDTMPDAELSPPSERPARQEGTNASAEPSSRPVTRPAVRGGRASAALQWLEELGKLAKNRPLTTSCAALGLAFVGAFALIGVKSSLDVRRAEAPSAAVGDVDDNDAAKPTTAPQRAAAQPAESQDTFARGALQPVTDEKRATAVNGSGATEPSDVALAQDEADASEIRAATAVGHLRAGRYEEARRAYARLAAAHPDVEAFQVAARLLTKRLGSTCATEASSTACPKVQR